MLQTNRFIPSRKLSKQDFVNKANKIHNNKFSYPDDYINGQIKMRILCKKHGSFHQRPDMHIQGHGCPICKASKGELKIYHYLKNKKINILREYRIEGYKYRYNFYLPDYNLLIEYHGGQHYLPIPFFGGEKGLWERRFKDKIKRNLARRNGYNMLTIPYTKFNKIINILNRKLKIK